jgi:hypothetical protein
MPGNVAADRWPRLPCKQIGGNPMNRANWLVANFNRSRMELMRRVTEAQ